MPSELRLCGADEDTRIPDLPVTLFFRVFSLLIGGFVKLALMSSISFVHAGFTSFYLQLAVSRRGLLRLAAWSVIPRKGSIYIWW